MPYHNFFFFNMVEDQFFQSLTEFVLHQNNKFQGWLCTRKICKKNTAEKCAPPRVTRVKCEMCEYIGESLDVLAKHKKKSNYFVQSVVFQS